MFDEIPEIPCPSIIAPIYLKGRPPAIEKEEATQIPLINPKKNKIPNTDQ